MNNIYDFVVIGAGISACTFASSLNKICTDASILLVEHGRRIGGRATTRKSRKNKILEFDHGLPSISFSKNISTGINSLISPLINSEQLVDISNNILIINETGEINNLSNNLNNYRSLPFMINFSEAIINESINPKKIYFLFQTLVKSITRKNNLWQIEIDNYSCIKSENLILSSSLIAHPRCLKIMQINSLPLRDALRYGEDEIVDCVLKKVKEQRFICRKIYIFHVNNPVKVSNFGHKYLQIVFSKILRFDLNFERIIFQIQSDGSMIISLHCSYLDELIDIDTDKVVQSLMSIFTYHNIFLDLFLEARLIDKMDWRASQPFNNLLSKDLQWSSTSNIGFCGDWFDLNCCRGVETAMNSSIRLSKLIV
tara:strand:- start:134 stop:1243 length:1110 start_codon:yes stop_codon:yes gene_type:complete